MHGLINRSIQCFLRDAYGADRWAEVARESKLGFDNFETMSSYDDSLTSTVLETASRLLARPQESLMEDLGTYLVSYPNLQALRRLLRFSGVTFVDFLHSLDDLPGRGRLAVPDLDLPSLELQDLGNQTFTLSCRNGAPMFGHVLVGILRAMADDYGALVVLEHLGAADGAEQISITLLEEAFADAKPFPLAARSR